MPDFQGNDEVVIKTNDTNIPIRFQFTNATVAGNDGALPYGSTISSYTLTAYKLDTTDTDATSELVSSHSRDELYITVNLKYPSGAGFGDGRYSLQFILTLDTGAEMQFDFDRVVVKS